MKLNKFILLGIVLLLIAFGLIASPIPFDEVIAGVGGLILIIKGL